MATNVGGMKELNAFMEKKMLLWLTKVQAQLPQYLEKFIYSEYYDQYQPTDLYERQYRIIEAIMVSSIKKVGNTYTISIYLDPNKVSYDPSLWYDTRLNSWGVINGDTSEDVFNLMANGIHGTIENGQTEGRFWEAFVESVNHGGIHDLFEDFKRYLGGKGILNIS